VKKAAEQVGEAGRKSSLLISGSKFLSVRYSKSTDMSNPEPPLIMAPEDLRDLREAKLLLENPGLTARLANTVGAPIEKGFAMLPKNWSDTVHHAARLALFRALDVAVNTLDNRRRAAPLNLLHKIAVGAAGGLGGAFGLPALAIELPVSTTIMMRSIADIARTNGHDIRQMPVKLSCMEVFALGGRSHADDSAESAYWAVRAALSHAISEAAAYFAGKRMLETGAPTMVRLVGMIAQRFGLVVSQQVAAKAVPIIGAAGGSIVNVLFMDHFQNMARGHFIVKRLEETYGTESVQQMYKTIAMPIN
jgi:hypothetical protein